jgi:dienelactone hydrolase
MRFALPAVGMIAVLVHVAGLTPFAAEAQNAAASPHEQASTPADAGQYFPFLQKHAEQQRGSLSYLAKEWPNADEWRRLGRERMRVLLAYDPPACPLNPEVVETIQKDGYRRLLIRFAITAERKTEAFLLIPNNLKGKSAAVLALHDHGGFYYFGKEKVTETDNPPESLQKFIETAYGGRTFADELARRGFVVLVPDAFYFGSQRIDPAQISKHYSDVLDGLTPGTDEFVRAYNKFASGHETLVAKTIFTSGTTWPGILFHGDRVALDYLLSRPEVDPQRVGCMGLSIGGFRAAHLTGLDSRIKAAVVAGWMTTYDSLLKDHLRAHTWMIYVPGQLPFLDLPDVASLNAPSPLLIANCSQDALFPLSGMQNAEAQLRAVYTKLQQPDRFECRYYDLPHSLTIPMQNDAIDWLERWLKPGKERQ